MKIRVGSLIKFLEDGDVGIVLELVDEEPDEEGEQQIMIWWCRENAKRRTGIETFAFEPFGDSETVLRY